MGTPLEGLLPYIFGRADALKRQLKDAVTSPLGLLGQRAGQLEDATNSVAGGGLLAPHGSPAYQRWSDAVDQMAGGLLGATAYHGSPHLFDKFDIAKAGTTTDAGQLGKGIYFSTDKRVAAGYPNQYAVDVNMSSPMRIEMPDFYTDKGGLIRKALGLKASATADEVTAAAKVRGHDGVVLDYTPTGYKHQEIALFDAALAKILERNGQPLGLLGP